MQLSVGHSVESSWKSGVAQKSVVDEEVLDSIEVAVEAEEVVEAVDSVVAVVVVLICVKLEDVLELEDEEVAVVAVEIVDVTDPSVTHELDSLTYMHRSAGHLLGTNEYRLQIGGSSGS